MAEQAIAAVADHHALSGIEVSVLGCDDARITVLNGTFREKPKPTNVLSWPEADLAPGTDGADPQAPAPGPDGTHTLGDIAIAYDTCAREAEAQGKPFADHVTHLLVHGTLHLLGYDHMRPRDAARMEALEVKILGKLGVPDPY
ncbi:rRNA maturation RNase YbeY [Tateyamaria sp. SN6-1]|uniref:rRNA maturation RNase YbeY n=1 Tax=Tateyamaria sp. SN6-1 TaxID=3092148 RepID=UPI0039F4DA3F